MCREQTGWLQSELDQQLLRQGSWAGAGSTSSTGPFWLWSHFWTSTLFPARLCVSQKPEGLNSRHSAAEYGEGEQCCGVLLLKSTVISTVLTVFSCRLLGPHKRASYSTSRLYADSSAFWMRQVFCLVCKLQEFNRQVSGGAGVGIRYRLRYMICSEVRQM